MENSIIDQKGVTLVELLAVLVLLSLVGLMTFGIYLTGKNEYDIQKEKTEHQQNVQYAIKYLTKEIRMKNTFERIDDNNLKVGDNYYSFKNNILYKNDSEVLADNIENFLVTSIPGDSIKTIKIQIVSKKKFERNNIDAETTISIR